MTAGFMIYVQIEAIKSEGRGSATGNGWHDTDDPIEAIQRQMQRFTSTWDALGHGAAPELHIIVATEASPRRTVGKRWPLPVHHPSTTTT